LWGASMSSTHRFALRGSWKGGRDGKGTIEASGLKTEVSIPVTMNGLGIGTNPEEMLLGAATTCYMITLGLMLTKRGIEVDDLTVESEGILVQDPDLRYDRIHYKTFITKKHADPETVERLETLAIQAEKNCMISAAIRGNVEVTVEPRILTE
jgi:peroxiredoxin-like protein